MSGTSLIFDPLLAWPVVASLAALALMATGLALWRGLKGWWLRALGFALLVLALANPSVQTENRMPLPDIALVVEDRSASDQLRTRPEQLAGARAELSAELARLGVEERYVSLGDAPQNGGTHLYGAIREALGELPRDRVAGVLILSDGIAHDESALDVPAPVHLVQTGAPDDWDRRLIISNAPAYGILGETLQLTLRIDEEGAVPEALRGRPARVGFSINGEELRYAEAPVGQDLTLDLTLEHGGVNVLHFTLETQEGELTTRNNQAVVQINGVRDRLRVLLVSGEPHTGQRTWRNLLKSDPAVDLVHFTILRPPNRQDGVPSSELSLIAFPTRELFVDKIDEFDLIIFDRYRLRGILPRAYFENIRRYLTEGGALLVAGGSELAGAESISRTALGRVLPAQPTARMFTQPFLPTLSDAGRRHPVTADLAEDWSTGNGGDTPGWGRWLRQVEMTASDGQVVMTGVDDNPLLILAREGEGRVAVLASDQAWLWDRGFEGGGPQAELLRRLAHWMMAEPDLEEEALNAETITTPDGRAGLRIIRRSMETGPFSVQITTPAGEVLTRDLTEGAPGRFGLDWAESDEPGLYRLQSGTLETVAVLGTANPLEFAQVVANSASVEALLAQTGGTSVPVSAGLPALRLIEAGRQAHGRGWLGLTPRAAYVTTDLRLSALLPVWVWLLGGVILMLGAWLREAHR